MLLSSSVLHIRWLAFIVRQVVFGQLLSNFQVDHSWLHLRSTRNSHWTLLQSYDSDSGPHGSMCLPSQNSRGWIQTSNASIYDDWRYLVKRRTMGAGTLGDQVVKPLQGFVPLLAQLVIAPISSDDVISCNIASLSLTLSSLGDMYYTIWNTCACMVNYHGPMKMVQWQFLVDLSCRQGWITWKFEKTVVQITCLIIKA